MKIRRKAGGGIVATWNGKNSAVVPPPDPKPWGWQAAPAETLLRVLCAAGYDDAERFHSGQHAASFRMRRGEVTLFVTWFYGGGFSVATTGDELPQRLVDCIVDFVNEPVGGA